MFIDFSNLDKCPMCAYEVDWVHKEKKHVLTGRFLFHMWETHGVWPEDVLCIVKSAASKLDKQQND